MGISDSNTTSTNDNTIIEITDGLESGNRAEVTAQKELRTISTITPGDNGIPYWRPNKIKWEDMTAIVRGTNVSTTFTTAYQYLGSGYFYGFAINLEDANNIWYIRLNIDDNYPFFGSIGIDTKYLNDQTGYDLSDVGSTDILSIGRHDNTIRLDCKYPIKYESKVLLEIRRSTTNKKFQAGFVLIHKD